MKIRPIKSIRMMLGSTQVELAEAMDCTQMNVSKYERGQTVPPSKALLLVSFAQGKGLRLTFGMIYGAEPLPVAKREVVMGVTL